MLIKVLLPGEEEGLFNADCLVASLLDSIKKRHSIPRDDEIDLCTLDGHVKELNCHLSENGCQFAKLYERYLVVKVLPSCDDHPAFIPALDSYAHNQQFVALLNHKTENGLCVRVKVKGQPPVHRPRPPLDHHKTHSSDKGKNRKRRLSLIKH